jgi:hypothetical protein
MEDLDGGIKDALEAIYPEAKPVTKALTPSLPPLLQSSPSMEDLDGRIKDAVDSIYLEAKATAKEFNVRGDLHAGAIMAGFLRVADTIICHGAV